jgi:hypothetical protein
LSSGFGVIDRHRSTTVTDDLSANHGDFVVVAATDAAISPLVAALYADDL